MKEEFVDITKNHSLDVSTDVEQEIKKMVEALIKLIHDSKASIRAKIRTNT